MANQIGKRYFCKKCGSEFIVTRGGDGTIRMNGTTVLSVSVVTFAVAGIGSHHCTLCAEVGINRFAGIL